MNAPRGKAFQAAAGTDTADQNLLFCGVRSRVFMGKTPRNAST